jgi:hypothetical protein
MDEHLTPEYARPDQPQEHGEPIDGGEVGEHCNATRSGTAHLYLVT